MAENDQPGGTHSQETLKSAEEVVVEQPAHPGRDAREEVIYLRQHLGDAFIDWLLADPSEDLSQQQAEVAVTIADLLRKRLADQPDLPANLAASTLAFYVPAWGTTSINHFRKYAAQSELPSRSSSGDPLLDAIVDLAVESYGELLLPYHDVWSPSAHLTSPVSKKVITAVRNEGIFPLGANEFDMEAVAIGTSDGIARDFQAASYGSNLVFAGWELSKLRAGVPTLDELIEKLPDVLVQARSLFSGNRTLVTAVTSFTGIRLPEGVEISGPWGLIRPARIEDHPTSLERMLKHRTMTTDERGEQVEITDAGDVIFEATIGMTMQVKHDMNQIHMETSTAENFADLIDRTRLAFALAVKRETRPILISTWSRFITPLFNGGYSYNDPQHMASRHPTALSAEEVASWSDWIKIVMASDMSHLNLAMTRTLRALTERRDPSDMLIDSVIAWESLFGATSESVLRVSASLAKLLHPAGEKRDQARTRYSKIYALRSNIVHGNNFKSTPQQIHEDGQAAADIALEAIGALLARRRDILTMNSADRSLKIILEDAESVVLDEAEKLRDGTSQV
ncbi:hypothetical protein ABZU75_14310 [Streptosporangium sp. NPDC005286]|uniref:hypothetical protein n=1 Tax=Streptosporangium sp. NPDC005286 TaxID=3154463 RepID=UPI0033AC90E6